MLNLFFFFLLFVVLFIKSFVLIAVTLVRAVE